MDHHHSTDNEDRAGDVVYNHHAPSFVSEHFDIHRKLRADCPIAWSSSYGGFWVISRYEDVFAAAHDDATFSSAISQLIPQVDVGRLAPIQIDPPELPRFRSLLSRYFAPRALTAFEPALQADIDTAVARILRQGGGELVDELCNPIPARTTMRLLGLDPDEWRVFGDPLHLSTFSPPETAEHAAAVQDILGFSAIIEAEVDDRYRHPRADMISELTTSTYEGIDTSRQEVVDLVRMVIFGGMDTVMASLSNAFAILATDHALRGHLATHPDAIPQAIEEFLRYEAPIQGFARKVMRTTELGGQRINEGELVFLLWGSANHDEAVFHDPSKLDVERIPNRHCTFGVGAHRCQGSTLARRELRATIESFLTAIPDFSLADPGIIEPATIGQILGKREVHIEINASR